MAKKRKKWKIKKRNIPVSRTHNPVEYKKIWNAIYRYSGDNRRTRDKKIRLRWARRWRQGYIFKANDETYMVTKLASEQTRLTYLTFREYVVRGIIPKPIYFRDIHVPTKFGKDYVGFYSQTQVNLIKKAFPKKEKKSKNLNEASRFLYDNWEKYEKNLGDQSYNGDNYEKE